MSNVFADSLQQGAMDFGNQTMSFAQIRLVGKAIKVRLQAIEIMKQFDRDVTYGSDARGILFYTSLTKFQLPRVHFTYTRTPESKPNFVSIQIDFKGRDEPKPFARFVAKLDTSKYNIPDLDTGGGRGRWHNLRIATAAAHAFRPRSSANITLQFGPVHREAVFSSNRTTEFNVNGLFIFKDITQLKDQPDPHDPRKMYVQCAPDLCVFRYHPNGPGAPREFGLFLPNVPLDLDQNLQPPEVKWYDFTEDIVEEDTA